MVGRYFTKFLGIPIINNFLTNIGSKIIVCMNTHEMPSVGRMVIHLIKVDNLEKRMNVKASNVIHDDLNGWSQA
jgi:hypothetical protein